MEWNHKFNKPYKVKAETAIKDTIGVQPGRNARDEKNEELGYGG